MKGRSMSVSAVAVRGYDRCGGSLLALWSLRYAPQEMKPLRGVEDMVRGLPCQRLFGNVNLSSAGGPSFRSGWKGVRGSGGRRWVLLHGVLDAPLCAPQREGVRNGLHPKCGTPLLK